MGLWEGKHFLVWGFGRTGQACASVLARLGARVTVLEAKGEEAHPKSKELLAGLPIQILWQVEALPPLEDVAALLLSPGVPYDHPWLQEARQKGVEVVAEIEWASRFLTAPILAVTGSVGKSTTTSLAGAIFEASGFRTFTGGNLGTPLIALLQQPPVERIALECSSFQLEACSTLQAEVAILTNLRPNHLDRHKTMEAYADAKARLFTPLPPEAWIIARAGDQESLPVLQKSQARKLFFYPEGEISESSFGEGAMIKDGRMHLRLPGEVEEVYPLSAMKLRGAHNRENLMAAALATRLMGGMSHGVQLVLEGFAGLAHRMEEIGRFRGVTYINDSKSTTPASTLRAIESFDPRKEPLRLLLGGRSKGTGFSALRPAMSRSIRSVYVFGEAAEEIARDLEGSAEIHLYPEMTSAIRQVFLDAKQGEIVLLSPSCTSFDQFTGFEARGDHFKRLIREYVSNPPPTDGSPPPVAAHRREQRNG